MKQVAFVYHEAVLGHEPPIWHPESRERILGIIDALKAADLWEKLLHVSARSADFYDLALIHTPEYIEKVFAFGGESLDPDTYVSPGTLAAVRRAAGSVMDAVDLCRAGTVMRAFCCIRPPGHHAEPDSAMGFCIFNNIAIGAAHAQRSGLRKVFIVDFDAHHGNGTQHAFEESDTVSFFSTHQYPFYPETGREIERGTGKGLGFTCNIQVLRGSGNKDYLYLYQDILPGIISRFEPDIIMVSAGYDIHTNDPHADIRVTGEGIRGMVRAILTAHPCPVVFVLEGGYDIPSLQESVVITIREMLKVS